MNIIKYSKMNENLSKDDLKEGDRIEHKVYGKGTIEKIDNNIEIHFDKENFLHVFHLETLLNNGYIKKIDDDKNNNFLEFLKNSKKDKEDNEKSSKPRHHDDIEIEEEEEEEWNNIDYYEDITEEELEDMEMKNFFNDNELDLISPKEYFLNIKEKIKNEKSKKNPIKEKINKKRLNYLEIILTFFNKLSELYQNKTVYKYTGQIPYEELWDIKKKYRLNDKDTDLNNFIKSDFIYYWVFKDSVVFKMR